MFKNINKFRITIERSDHKKKKVQVTEVTTERNRHIQRMLIPGSVEELTVIIERIK